MLTQLRNIFIVVCALNFLALMGLAGALYTGGAISRNTLFEAVYLFRGTHRAVPQEAVDDYERMRKENEQLRMEREILKKAAVFFAKETE